MEKCYVDFVFVVYSVQLNKNIDLEYKIWKLIDDKGFYDESRGFEGFCIV